MLSRIRNRRGLIALNFRRRLIKWALRFKIINFILNGRRDGHILSALNSALAGNYGGSLLRTCGSSRPPFWPMKLGAMDYLAKGSVTPESVSRAVRNAIEKFELQRGLARKGEMLIERNRADVGGPSENVGFRTWAGEPRRQAKLKRQPWPFRFCALPDRSAGNARQHPGRTCRLR